MRGLIILATVLVAAGGVAHAGDERAAAREHFQKGTKYFDLGKFEEAVKEYEAAYEAVDDPVLLYNIAQAHRLAGHTERALFFYRSYLRRNPNAKNQAEVDLKIAELQKALDQQARAQGIPPATPLPPRGAGTTPSPRPAPAVASTTPKPGEAPRTGEPPPPATTTEPPPPAEQPPTPAEPPTAATTPPPAVEQPRDPGRLKKIIGFSLVGVGAAALVGGIVCGVLAKSDGDAVTSAANNEQVFDPARESAGKGKEIGAGVLYGIGAAAVVAGGVVVYLGYRDSKRAASSRAMLVPVVSPTHAGAQAVIRF